MVGYLVAIVLLAGPSQSSALDWPASPPPISQETAARVAPVAAAIKAERDAQAKLPPPRSDAERLVRMGRLDQVGRNAALRIDIHDLTGPEQWGAQATIWLPINAIDAENQAQLLKMVPPEGWFYRSRYGAEAADAAFLIVQHSKPELWRRFLPVLESLVAKGEVRGPAYALMYDRLAISESRPQRYGSQLSCRNGRFAIDPVEAPETVNQRRKAMGFPDTLAQYERTFAAYPPC